MNLDNQLRKSLQAKGENLIPPRELKTKVMNRIMTTNNKLKKRLIASIIAAALIVPTGVFAAQTFLADELYGSFENVKKHIASATMEGFQILNAKLSQAKGELGEEEYELFKTHLKVVTSSKIEYADQYGNIDYDQVPAEKVEEIKLAMLELQPYFDKLNGQISSKDVLTTDEYVQYIEALMTYEKVLVQSGINPSEGPVEAEMIPQPLKAKFLEANKFMSYVDEKQMKIN